jgi:TetR/AcrR family transcriptional regulator, mexJK operon transcriptional repressor
MEAMYNIENGRLAPEPPSRSRGRPKTSPDEIQRKAIAGCGQKLFLEKGYGNTTTDDLAARCRISKHTLYRLFPSKASVFAAVVDAHRQHWLNVEAGEDESLMLDEALARIFLIDISAETDTERLALLRLIATEAQFFPELAGILKQCGTDVSRQKLADWLARQAARGRIIAENPEELAHMLVDMICGALVLKSLDRPGWTGRQDRQALIHRCISVFLNGVRPRG